MAAKKTKATSKEMYLVMLEGQGDLDMKLVGKATFDWINSERPDMPDYSADEEVPAAVLAENPEMVERGKTTIQVTSGSCENDRAMNVVATLTFDSVVEAMKYIAKNKINLVDEFTACIY